MSFIIDADHYWLRLDADRVQDDTGLQILGWASITLALTLIGAIFISRFINNPLSQLSAAARELANGAHRILYQKKDHERSERRISVSIKW